MQMTNFSVKYEVFVKQYLRVILDISGVVKPKFLTVLTSPCPSKSSNVVVSVFRIGSPIFCPAPAITPLKACNSVSLHDDRNIL